jgi:hypothetical protein
MSSEAFLRILLSSGVTQDDDEFIEVHVFGTMTAITFQSVAQHVLRDTTFVDRLVGDFAAVLRFHSLRKASSSFNYKSDHCLCRVAKRSDRSLRRTMHSIANGNYDKAEQLEADYSLRVAA